MKNKLTDLNNHLFMALERLNEEGLSDDELVAEVKRAKSISDLGNSIVGIAGLQLDAAKLVALHGDRLLPSLPMLPQPRDEK